MVMEMAGHGDLLEYVKLRGALPDDKSKRLFAQLVSAVQYLHSIDIVHRLMQVLTQLQILKACPHLFPKQDNLYPETGYFVAVSGDFIVTNGNL